mmetsp:Transcript_8997/g.28600  ORF Transcript_8997/g.28600 Transcript_8997/m.28600 type:complete len:276 (+) Transcript_8997:1909-2736(+)
MVKKFCRRPTRAGSKKPKASPVSSCIIPLMTKFVEVPMRVNDPPPMLANDRGIRNLDAANSRTLAQSRMIGMNRATRGALLMKQPKNNVMQINRRSDITCVVFSPRVARAVRSISLERSTPLTTMNMDPTTTRESLLKPSSACLLLMMPMFQTTQSARNMTTSGVRSSVISSTRAINITSATKMACHVLSGFASFPWACHIKVLPESSGDGTPRTKAAPCCKTEDARGDGVGTPADSLPRSWMLTSYCRRVTSSAQDRPHRPANRKHSNVGTSMK